MLVVLVVLVVLLLFGGGGGYYLGGPAVGGGLGPLLIMLVMGLMGASARSDPTLSCQPTRRSRRRHPSTSIVGLAKAQNGP